MDEIASVFPAPNSFIARYIPDFLLSPYSVVYFVNEACEVNERDPQKQSCVAADVSHQ